MQKKVWVSFIVLCVLLSPLYGQSRKDQWVDSVLNTLDVDAKIGQLLVVSLEKDEDQSLERQFSQIKKHRVGTVILEQSGPFQQIRIIRSLQQAEVPMLVGMNFLNLALDSVTQFPAPQILGAIRDDSLIFFLGKERGRQLNMLGINFNFGTPADLNSSINSFGENAERVASKVTAFQTGLVDAEIRSFPTYSVTTSNLLPIQQALKNGSSGLILDQGKTFNLPEHGKLLTSKLQTLSNALINQFSPASLKMKTNFDGVVVSSIPDIRKLNKKFRAGDSEVLVFKAGNDMLLNPVNLNAAVRRLRRTLKKDKVLQARLDESVRRILAVKFDVRLTEKRKTNTDNLQTHLNTPASTALQSALFEHAVTVVRDENQFLPIKQLDDVSFASLSIGEPKENLLNTYLSKYATFSTFRFQVTEDTVGLVSNLSKHTCVVIAVNPATPSLEDLYPSLIQQVAAKTNVIVVEMGTPSRLATISNMPTIIQAYTNHAAVQQFIPQLIFGARKSDGVLPVTVNDFKQGQGIQTVSLQRMGYSTSEAEGLDSKTMEKIAAIARESIEQSAAPGSQVLVARHGKIVYEKSFGAQTYDNGIPIDDKTIYDLASVSKVMGTLQGVMFLYEKGMIDIYKKASVYLPELATTNKKDIILKDILTHQSGLAPFLLMWPQTAKGDTLLPYYYSSVRNESYPLQVAPQLFASPVMRDSIWQWIIKSPILNKPPRTPYTPRYSDLGFMILHRLVERLVNQPMEEFLSQNLYEPIGAASVGYMPLDRFPANQIAPTELDTIFRKSIVLGTVHDERAAMLGGIAGHAGLFGSGIDLIKIGQMLLQGGSYGGQQYYRPETLELFAQKQFENSTRGLGWAKPGDPNSPSSRFGSTRAFGHTGFTGTCIWMDPEFDLVFVFLSNSRFPYRSGKLNTTNIRSRIQDTIYQSIFNHCQYGDQESDHELMEYLRKSSN